MFVNKHWQYYCKFHKNNITKFFKAENKRLTFLLKQHNTTENKLHYAKKGFNVLKEREKKKHGSYFGGQLM